MSPIREKSAKEREGDESAKLIKSRAFNIGDIVALPRRGEAKVLRFTTKNAVVQFSDGDCDYRHVQLLKKVGKPKAIK